MASPFASRAPLSRRKIEESYGWQNASFRFTFLPNEDCIRLSVCSQLLLVVLNSGGRVYTGGWHLVW